MKTLMVLSGVLLSGTCLAATVERVHNDANTTTFNNSLDPQGEALYFTQVAADLSGIQLMRGTLANGSVKQVEPLQIAGVTVDGTDIHLSPDGQQLFYVARQPLDKSAAMKDHDIYVSNKTPSGWTMPRPLPGAVNSTADEFYPSIAANGDLYFARRIEGDNLDIFVSRFVDGTYQQATVLGPQINSPLLEGDGFVSPDGNLLIFARMKGQDSLGMTDLYISIRRHGQWSQARHLGQPINSEGIDGSPFISRDNQWLYLTSSREADDPSQFGHGLGVYRIALSAVLAAQQKGESDD